MEVTIQQNIPIQLSMKYKQERTPTIVKGYRLHLNVIMLCSL